MSEPLTDDQLNSLYEEAAIRDLDFPTMTVSTGAVLRLIDEVRRLRAEVRRQEGDLWRAQVAAQRLRNARPSPLGTDTGEESEP